MAQGVGLARPYYQPDQFQGPDLAAIQQNALLTQKGQQQNLMGQYQLDMMPEEVNYLRRKRQLDLTKATQGLFKEQQSMAESARKQATEDLKAIVPLIRMTKDPRARVGLVTHAMEIAADVYGDRALQGLPLPDHPAWQNDEYLTEIEKALGIETPEAKKPQTKLGKLIAERNALPEDDPQIKLYDAAISKEATRTGERVTVNPDGTVTWERGVTMGEGGQLEKPVLKDIQTKLLGGREQLARLENIKTQFDPEWLTLGGKAEMWATGMKSYLDIPGLEISPEKGKKYDAYIKFRRDVAENINLYIKEITGAQMSESEATRLGKAMPQDKDNPHEFQSKLDSVLKATRAAVKRYQYYLNKGLSEPEVQKLINSGAAIPLADIEARM